MGDMENNPYKIAQVGKIKDYLFLKKLIITGIFFPVYAWKCPNIIASFNQLPGRYLGCFLIVQIWLYQVCNVGKRQGFTEKKRSSDIKPLFGERKQFREIRKQIVGYF